MKLLVSSLVVIVMLVLSSSVYDFERSGNILDRSNILKISIWSSLITKNNYTVKNVLVGNGLGSIKKNHDLESYNEFGALYSDTWTELDENAPKSAHNGIYTLLVLFMVLAVNINTQFVHSKGTRIC